MGDPIVDQGKWGICGFVCVLNALHETGKLKEFGKDLDLQAIHQRLGAELITYLKMTNVERPKIAAEILSYTQSFGPPYSGYKSIDDICTRIASELKAGRAPNDASNSQGGIGVALPTVAVLDYCSFAGLDKAKQKTVSLPAFSGAELNKHRDSIVGVGRKLPPNAPLNGLRHWVYVDPKGVLFNWGTKTDLNKTAPTGMNFDHVAYVVQLS